MTGDSKIWLRLPAATLALVDQRRGQQPRSEALRELIDRGLAASTTSTLSPANDDGITIQVTGAEKWAVGMAAWHLEVAAATWKAAGGVGESTGWIVDAPIDNIAEWSAWASRLRGLVAKFGDDSK